MSDKYLKYSDDQDDSECHSQKIDDDFYEKEGGDEVDDKVPLVQGFMMIVK